MNAQSEELLEVESGTEESGGGGVVGWVGGLLFVFVLCSGAALMWLNWKSEHDKQYLDLTAQQRVLSQQIAKFALEATKGDDEGFRELDRKTKQFARTLTELREGNPDTGLPPTEEALQDELQQLEISWGEYRKATDNIIQGKESILLVGEAVQNIRDNLPRLTEYSDKVVQKLVSKGARTEQVYQATRQLMLAQRIANHLNKVLAGGAEVEQVIELFEEDVEEFGTVMEGMLRSEKSSEALLRDISMFFTVIVHNVEEIIDRSEELVQVQLAASEVGSLSDKLLERIGQLSIAYADAPDNRLVTNLFAQGLLAFTVFLLVMFGFLWRGDAKRRQEIAEQAQRGAEEQAATQAEQNQRNQEAILRLLDEMGDLAEGDLTVHATVTEDFTGAIADSINYAIDELRGLVTTINETSVQVSSAAQETQATAMHLAEASDHQAQQITSASAAINEMAVSIDQVSKNADVSTEVSQKSVDIARRGGETVRKTIDGMNNIREQIQETSKRIKRLGESSQEIGDIVELINDIADQTNILALNAAIQAAMAGEAGRGFAVVADEVQRLAERSGNATKQIEALVKTIQSDTKEAVISMEQSTANVVSGAKLAEDGGNALDEIETVSLDMSNLIQGISDAARQQANAAANISDTMNVIQEITTQTSAGTNETSTSIGNLADLANELRKSVAGFKLPE